MNHHQDFAEMQGHIQKTRQRVFAQANTALIDLYWRIGQTVSHKAAQGGWGKGVVAELARYIAQADPSLNGFSDKNLWRMKQFYETYQGNEELSPLLRALPWSHNLAIFSRCKTAEDRRFYPLAADEQKRIADCLNSLDDLFNAATQELETLKTHKKGLMQQLFLSEEVLA